MAEVRFICDFLSRVEGGCQTRGYIPCYLRAAANKTANYRGGPNPENYRAMGASGVTIATGCDLGQTDAKTLLAYGLDPAIVGVFSPYFGRKKDAAILQLHKLPLVISPSAAQAVDHAVLPGYLRRHVIPAYEKASGASFDAIPKEAQAVIMSLCFQKGCAGVARGWPITWGHLIAQNWKAAAHELMAGFTQYVSRRRTEGKLLAEVA